MEKDVKILVGFVVLVLISFLSYFLISSNYEFLSYIFIAVFLFFLIIWANKYYNFPLVALWFFVIWIILHMAGGSLYINGTRLYDILLINIFNGGGEFVILKYDQLIHAYCYFAVSILIYFMLKKHMKPNQNKALIIFTILSAIGVGLLNEVLEFSMVIFADAAEAVGGYYNTALDLVFNLIGAIIGTIFANFLNKL